MSQLIFIPVPGGVRADGARTLRLVVVPRLDTGSLADNGLTSWPPTQLRAPLPVTFTTDGNTSTTVEITPRMADQDGLWSAVFGNATVTTPAAVRQDATADSVTVTPTSVHHRQLDTSYRAVVQAYATAAATDPQNAPAAYAAAARTQLSAPPWVPPPISLAPSDAVPPTDSAPPAVPPTDVNRIYGMLREHPRVLAALGLILELDIPSGSVPDGEGIVRVDWPAAASVTPPLPPVVPRSTAYLAGTFIPAPHDDPQAGTIDQGMVCLDDDTRWQLAAVDVEAGMLRMTGAARSGPDPTIARGDASTPTLTNALPTLRTAGLTLMRTGRANDFTYRRARALAVAADDDPTLYAEDLVLGYRFDVRLSDGDDTWHPLCARQATYRVNDVVVGAAGALEEGHVKAHAAHRDDDSGQLLADEVVARWDGWSLAVPRPFPPSVITSDPGEGAALAYRLGTEFTVPPGSLPPLRFGSSYDLRARVADLAGGGVAADDPIADQHAILGYPFSRYEPVLAPTVLPPDGANSADLGPGVHVAQLVVTSEGGDATTIDPVTPAQAQRQLGRPVVSLTTAEWHGALVGDPDVTWPVAQLALAGELPDPAAVGLAACIVPEPGSPAVDVVRQPWPGWPDTTAAAIQLKPCAAGTDVPVLSFGADGLIVALAPAQDIAVQLSSTVARDDVTSLAVAGWSADGVDGLADAGLAATTSGQHPMVTPVTTVRCMHAVRRPLADPSGGLEATRMNGVVPVTIIPTRPLFGVDAASTGQVDISASWTEVVDDVRTDFVDVPVQSLVVNRGDVDFAQAITHHLPDTRHRGITYAVTAVSRFRDFFPAGPDNAFTAAPLTCAVDVLSTNRPAPPKVRGIVPAFVWEQASGPMTVTRTRYGNRIRVELEGPWFDSGDDEQLSLVMAAPVTTDNSRTTQAGRDPMYFTPGCERWPPSSAVTGSPARVLTEDNVPVDVVPSEVFFDAQAGRWFADFVLPEVAGDSYTPMVRPALARYQRHSISGRELSPVVLGDFVPLMPDRTLTVSVEVAADRSQFTVTVMLSGPGPGGPLLNEVDVILERGGADTDLTVVNPSPTSVGWITLPDAQRGPLGSPIAITRPLESLSQLRVRVREIEQAYFPDPDHLDPDQPKVMGTFYEVGDRPVFVDTVPLVRFAPADQPRSAKTDNTTW